MDFWLHFLPIIIYILLIIILVIGIILGVKLLMTINKVDKVVDDVNRKVQTLNGFFHIIDYTTDKIALATDKITEGFISLFSKIFNKKKNKKKKIEKEDENE